MTLVGGTWSQTRRTAFDFGDVKLFCIITSVWVSSIVEISEELVWVSGITASDCVSNTYELFPDSIGCVSGTVLVLGLLRINWLSEKVVPIRREEPDTGVE